MMSMIMRMSKIWLETPEDIVNHILSFICPRGPLCVACRGRISPWWQLRCIRCWEILEKCNWIEVVCILFACWCGYVMFFHPT